MKQLCTFSSNETLLSKMISLSILAFCLCFGQLSPAQAAAPITAIINAKIIAMTSEKPYKGTLLIQNGKILSVGINLKVPKSATIIDAKGQTLTPGLAIAETTLGTIEINAIRSTKNNSQHTKDPVKASMIVMDGIDHNNTRIPVTRIEGVTSVMVVPRGGLVSGQSALVDLLGLPSQMQVRRQLAMHFAVRSGWKGSSAHAWQKLRLLLDETRIYSKNVTAYQKGQLRHITNSYSNLKAMLPVIQGKMPVVLNVSRAAEIARAITFAKQQKGIKFILSGVAEGWQLAKQIAAAKLPVILGSPRNLPYSFEKIGNRFDNAAILHKAGVFFAFGASGASMNVRNIRNEAGIAVSKGLPYQVALKAITSNLYEMFGLKESYGTLEKGRIANIVLWNGDPLELGTIAQKVWIRGKVIPMRSRQTMLRDRYRDLSAFRR